MSGAPARRGPRLPSMPHPEDAAMVAKVDPELEDGEPAAKKGGNIATRTAGRVGKQVRKKHACERAFTCALAVSLLWVTSLGMSKALVQYFIPTPEPQKVYNSGNDLLVTSQDQRQAYEQCALNTSDTCRDNFDVDLVDETARIVSIQNYVDNQLLRIKGELIDCSESYEMAIKVLNHFFKNGDDVNDYGFQKPECQASLGALVTTEAVRVESVQDVESFKATSDESVATLDQQVAARLEYDIAFFNATTGGAFGDSIDNLRKNLRDPEAFANSIREEFNKAMACLEETGVYEGAQCSNPQMLKVRESYDTALNRYNSLKKDVANFRAEAQAKLASFETLLSTLDTIYKALSAADLDALGGWIVVNYTEVVDNIRGVIDLRIEELVEEPTKMAEKVRADAEKSMSDLAAEAQAIDAANANISGQIDEIQALGFSDYDPPQPPEDDYDESSNSIIGVIKSDLASAGKNEEDNPDVQKIISSARINITDASSSLLEKADPRTWEAFAYEETVFSRFEDGFTSFNDYALAFDYAFRILHSLMLIRKYWMISAVSTPPADVRTKAGIDSGTFHNARNPMQLAAYILTHPAVNLILLLVFLGFFSITFYMAYEPLYTEYTENCVHRCWGDIENNITDNNGELLYPYDANGTMLYRNVFAIAEQYAFTDGDYVASTEVDALNIERDLTCRESMVDSFNEAVVDDDYFNFYQDRMVDLIGKVEYLRDCVDLGKVADKAATMTDELADLNITWKPLIRDTAECKDPFELLDDLVRLNLKSESRIFDCSNIRACEFNCQGPNEVILRSQTHTSACTIEWYAHASSIGFVMITTVYIIANISRIIFMRGIVKVFWRHLVTNRFSYLASCTESGRVIYPEAVTEKGESFKKTIMKELRVALGRFEREGMLETFFGVLINAPWIAILVILQNGLEFNEDKICT